MGQRLDRALFVCLWLVRALCVLAGLAVVGGIVYVLALPRHDLNEPSQVGDRAGELPPPAQPPADTAPSAPTATAPRRAPVLPDLDEPEGTTPFVRRLEIGAELQRLFLDAEQLGAEPAEVEARLARVMPFLLRADLPRKGRPGTKRLLRLLTEPRRDLDHLVLAGAERDDPLGTRLRVRAWTLLDPFPEDELSAAAKLVDAIVRRSGHDVDGGIDVLITPGMGADVFPFQARLKFAAGVYLQDDGYCAVRKDLPSGLREEVVQHELIHAYCRRLPGGFTSSRFISEGLAEYLRFVEPWDRDLAVPLPRLADHLAELEWMLGLMRRAGVKVGDIQPARLVDLPPREFYALWLFGYLTAQAAIAYVGGEVVERALAARSDAELQRALRAIEWRDFLRFVSSGGIGGSIGRAVVVPDVGPEDEEVWPSGREGFGAALRWLGADAPLGDAAPDPKIAQGAYGMPETGDDKLLNALRLVLAGEHVLVGLTQAELDRPVTFAPAPPGVSDFLGPAPAGETLRGFAERVVSLVAGDERLGASVAPSGRGIVISKRPPPPARPRRVVLVLGDSDPRDLEFFGLSQFEPAELEVLLVIDLSERAIGKAVTKAADGAKRVVAYWRPIVDG